MVDAKEEDKRCFAITSEEEEEDNRSAIAVIKEAGRL